MSPARTRTIRRLTFVGTANLKGGAKWALKDLGIDRFGQRILENGVDTEAICEENPWPGLTRGPLTMETRTIWGFPGLLDQKKV
uniref:Uncharacterized protein n=1 Tax=Rhizophora mucronata TaxID=61149 RepID=A0A2P2ITH2_RHIMU